MKKNSGFGTRAIHAGQSPDPTTGAVMTPVYLTSTYAQAGPGEHKGFEYSRSHNPTRFAYERCVADLEGGSRGYAFASGMAATATLLDLLPTGSHVVAVDDLYGGTRRLFERVRRGSAGLDFSYCDGLSAASFEKAITPNSRLIWVETPTNPLLKIVDLDVVVAVARKHKLISVCDNTFASPWVQRPLEHGFDVVMHSATKYLNGHSDVVVGVLCASKAMVKKIFESELMTLGGILGPHDAALVIRGLRTLPLRVQRSSESAQWLIAKLDNHPKVERIWYPFHHSFPQLELAKRQMRGCGGLFSVQFKTDSMEKMEAFIHRLERFLMGVSWGGHESLIIPTIGFYNIPGKSNASLPWTFVRFYIGLEDPEWLWEDLEGAMGVL